MENNTRPIKENIGIEELEKLDIRIGKIVEAKLIEGTELIEQDVDFGPEIGIRKIVSKIAKTISPSEIAGKSFLYVLNLPPRKMRGVESQGMIIGSTDRDTFVVGLPNSSASPGSIVF